MYRNIMTLAVALLITAVAIFDAGPLGTPEGGAVPSLENAIKYRQESFNNLAELFKC